MKVWAIKSKKGYLIDIDENDYGSLMRACFFSSKKKAKEEIEEYIDLLEVKEWVVKIKIKEIK